MVFILDEGSVFNAPLDKIWKLNASEGEHSHPSLKNQHAGHEGGYSTLSYETQLPDGSWAKHKSRVTVLPPLAVVFETIEGPLTGSKSIQFYTPKGDKTGVTVVGHWTSTMGVPDAILHQSVMGFLDTVFREDQNNLAKMK